MVGQTSAGQGLSGRQCIKDSCCKVQAPSGSTLAAKFLRLISILWNHHEHYNSRTTGSASETLLTLLPKKLVKEALHDFFTYLLCSWIHLQQTHLNQVPCAQCTWPRAAAPALTKAAPLPAISPNAITVYEILSWACLRKRPQDMDDSARSSSEADDVCRWYMC